MFAIQITFVDKYANSVDPLRLNAIQVFICSVLSAAVMLFREKPTLEGITQAVIPLAHTGFLSMGAAYAFQIVGQKDLGPTAASLIMSLESVFAVIFAALISKEVMTTWETVGCVFMFAAVILSQIPIKTKAKNMQQ